MPGFSCLKPGGYLRDLAGKSAAGSRGQKQELKQKLGHSVNLQTLTSSLLEGDASLCVKKKNPNSCRLFWSPTGPSLSWWSFLLHSIQCPGEPTDRQAHKSKSVAFSFQWTFKFFQLRMYFSHPYAFLFHLCPYNVVCSIFFQLWSIDLVGIQTKLFVNTYLGSMPEKKTPKICFSLICVIK